MTTTYKPIETIIAETLAKDHNSSNNNNNNINPSSTQFFTYCSPNIRHYPPPAMAKAPSPIATFKEYAKANNCAPIHWNNHAHAEEYDFPQPINWNNFLCSKYNTMNQTESFFNPTCDNDQVIINKSKDIEFEILNENYKEKPYIIEDSEKLSILFPLVSCTEIDFQFNTDPTDNSKILVVKFNRTSGQEFTGEKEKILCRPDCVMWQISIKFKNMESICTNSAKHVVTDKWDGITFSKVVPWEQITL